MAYTTPFDWIDGHRYTAADLNKLSGNFRALRTGGIAIPGQTAGDLIVAVSADQLGHLPASTVSDLETRLQALTDRVAVLEGKIP